MQGINLRGGLAKTRAPVEPAWSLHQTGIVHSALLGNVPFSLVTNGGFEVLADGKTVIGKTMFPIVMDPGYEQFAGHLDTWCLIKDVFELSVLVDKDPDLAKNSDFRAAYIENKEILKKMGLAGDGTRKQFADLFSSSFTESGSETMPIVPAHKFVHWRESENYMWAFDPLLMTHVLNQIQNLITVGIQRGSPKFRIVGLGHYELPITKGLKCLWRPVMGIRFNGKECEALWDVDGDPFTMTDKRFAATYFTIETLAFIECFFDRDFANKAKSAWNAFRSAKAANNEEAAYAAKDEFMRYYTFMLDAQAIHATLMAQYVGYKAPAYQNWYTAYDQMDSILSYMGIGYSKAYPFVQPDGPAWFLWNLIFGLACVRHGAMSVPGSLYRTKGLHWTIVDHLKAHTKAPYQVGGMSGVYYLPARMDSSDRLLLPCVVDDSDRNKVVQLKKYRPSPATFSRADITHGELTPGTIDPTSMVEKRTLMTVHWDTRIEEMKTMNRDLIFLRCPIAETVAYFKHLDYVGEKGLPTAQRSAAGHGVPNSGDLLMALLSNAKSCLTNGWDSPYDFDGDVKMVEQIVVQPAGLVIKRDDRPIGMAGPTTLTRTLDPKDLGPMDIPESVASDVIITHQETGPGSEALKETVESKLSPGYHQALGDARGKGVEQHAKPTAHGEPHANAGTPQSES